MQTEIIPHLFRTEFRKMTAVLCRQFGLSNLEMAEDIVSETFLTALEIWPYQGMPQNPTAWLYTVAKNKLKNHFNRDQLFREKIAPALRQSTFAEVQLDWSETNITDSQLAMLFALSHPLLSTESQIALSLRLLCGFGAEEIATAFLTNKETINKRLHRAKTTLREKNIALVLPSSTEMESRLETVLKTLYLLFSEGYYSESGDAILRKDLCAEAMHLTYLLIQHPALNKPSANALLALMCFHASRFDARKGANGEMILYNEQDETQWNNELIAKGIFYFHQSATGSKLSAYHLEAGIAYWHTQKNDSPEKWNAILTLYDQLLLIQYSPVAALNRIYALSKVKGVTVAICEAEGLQMNQNRFYFALLGELYKERDAAKAKQLFAKALSLTTSAAERQALEKQWQMETEKQR
jgi:RNA polymerase sigma-70 factor (ECF subfamily)